MGSRPSHVAGVASVSSKFLRSLSAVEEGLWLWRWFVVYKDSELGVHTKGPQDLFWMRAFHTRDDGELPATTIRGQFFQARLLVADSLLRLLLLLSL